MVMYKKLTKSLFLLFVVVGAMHGQNTEIDRQIAGELKMTFPSIYFKHKSADYASSPFKVDSCFKYIAAHIKDINDLVIWRDSLETEKLTRQRIKKLKIALSKHKETRNIYIESMGSEQKISRHTIERGTNDEQRQYLLSLNSVFDISKTRMLTEKKSGKRPHTEHPRIWCYKCWKNGRFTKEYRQHLKQLKKKEEPQKQKRHLVWTGWKTGFHWSTPGNRNK